MRFRKQNPDITITKVEDYPTIGTIEDPAYAWVGGNLLLAYKIAPCDGGGCTLILFKGASDVSIFPLNVEGFFKNTSGPYTPEFHIEPWQISEITGDTKTSYWKVLKTRRWMMSFMDYTMDILFEDVELKEVCVDIELPEELLLKRIDLIKK